ncbi:hypothetical protein MYXO_03086 [Myxococcaceae bacterium]|nr:hypothetical protein MYXO_03086 [Myxococcaceae bacterium]
MGDGSPGFRIAFIAVVAIVAAAIAGAAALATKDRGVTASRRSFIVTVLALAGWLFFSGRLAASGFLAFEPRPTLLPLLAIGVVGAFGVAFSRSGRLLAANLPLAVLVGYQAFRIPVEILLHRGHVEGLVPLRMTYLGANLDVLTGVTALLLAALSRLGPVPAWLLFAWNLVGFGLLVNAVTLALLSSPLPFRVFFEEPSNVWVTRFPWVWLPAFLVPAAVLGHLLVWRRLLAQRGGAETAEERGA